MKPKILVISHDANRAGAQLLLLRWLYLLKPYYSFTVLLKHEGVLRAEFENLATTWLWNGPHLPFTNRYLLRLFTPVFNRIPLSFWQKFLAVKIQISGFKAIISNTVTNGDILQHLPQHKPTITYVHELAYHFAQYTNAQDLAFVLKNTDLFLCCAELAAQNLIENHKILPEKTIYLPTPAPKIPEVFPLVSFTKQSNRILVGGCGSGDLRKGIDIFVEVAKILPQVDFVWIGATKQQFLKTLTTDKLPDNLTIIPNTPKVLAYLNEVDIFALTSRMEVFPLVAMETLMLQKPVLCFAEAGATSEMVENDAGIVVQPLSAEAMATNIRYLADNEALRKKMGEKGKEKISHRHQEEQSVAIFVRAIELVLLKI